MWTTEQFRDYLRAALKHIYDPQRLRSSPLVTVLGVADRPDASLALQEILVAAIDSLKPGSGTPPNSPASRIYHLLHGSYVLQLGQQEVADQLGVSVRQLRREQRAALQALTRQLWKRFKLDEQVMAEEETPTLPTATVRTPDLDQELGWLKEATTTEPVSLYEALTAVLDLLKPLAAQQGVRFETALDAGLPLLAGHPVPLRECLLNLLSVAVSRAAGGIVHLSAHASQWEIVVEVQCTRPRPGPKPSMARDQDCLEMARHLAELCAGRLTIVDERPFVSTLSLPALEQVSVLVVDDYADTLQLLQRYALGTRYRLAPCQDPQQAVAMAGKLSPQAIILDVMMPQLDGWAVLGRLQQDSLTRHIPVVVCTVVPQEALALALGASAFIRKPITRQAFLATLDRVVGERAHG